MQLTATLASALLAGVALAQAPTLNFSSSDIQSLLTSGGPNFVSATLRAQWCTSQHTACSTLCTNVGNNTCHPDTLDYSCTCAANNSAPGLQWYSTTLPNNICNALNGDCMKLNANDLVAQQNCNKTYVCEGINITTFGAAASSSAAASAASTQAAATGSKTTATSSASPSASKAAAAALAVGEQYGVGILGAGLLAVMGLVL